MSDALAECRTCGACCTSPTARYVPVRGDDWTRLGDDAERLTEWTERHAFMRMENGACIALDRSDGARCRIYERRPDVCRRLERGGPACEAERAQKLVVLTRRG